MIRQATSPLFSHDCLIYTKNGFWAQLAKFPTRLLIVCLHPTSMPRAFCTSRPWLCWWICQESERRRHGRCHEHAVLAFNKQQIHEENLWSIEACSRHIISKTCRSHISPTLTSQYHRCLFNAINLFAVASTHRYVYTYITWLVN